MKSAIIKLFCILICSCLLWTNGGTQATGQGFQGLAMDKETNVKIPSVKIVFVLEGTNTSKSVSTDANGTYRIDLNKGRYAVTATHADYETYSSGSGFFVVTGSGYQTANIFLKKKPVNVITTAIVLRHAEAGSGTDPDLTAAGQERAKDLAHVAGKAGVAAIYATQFKRTQQTAAQLAKDLDKTIIVKNDNDIAGLVKDVLTKYSGKTVVIVGHQPTVPEIIRQFGGTPVPSVEGHENLYIVTIYASGKAKVLNLQYGANTRSL